LGVAGAVENNMVKVTNIPHWATVNAEEIRQNLKHFDSFDLINDFAAAGL
jgi:glucokinase